MGKDDQQKGSFKTVENPGIVPWIDREGKRTDVNPPWLDEDWLQDLRRRIEQDLVKEGRSVTPQEVQILFGALSDAKDVIQWWRRQNDESWKLLHKFRNEDEVGKLIEKYRWDSIRHQIGWFVPKDFQDAMSLKMREILKRWEKRNRRKKINFIKLILKLLRRT